MKRLFVSALLLTASTVSALSASITRFEASLQWQGSNAFAEIYEDDGSGFFSDFVFEGNIDADNNPYVPLDYALADVDLAQPILFSATLIEDPGGFDSHAALECSFAGIQCSEGGNDAYDHASLSLPDFLIHKGDVSGFHIFGSLEVGEEVFFNEFSDDFISSFSDDLRYQAVYRDVISRFTVVDVAYVTSMPVPAGMVLLPVGIAALLGLRRRKAA